MRSGSEPRDETGEIELRIAPDGRLHIAVLTAPMLEVAAALCPDDPELAWRLALARAAARRAQTEGGSDAAPDGEKGAA